MPGDDLRRRQAAGLALAAAGASRARNRPARARSGASTAGIISGRSLPSPSMKRTIVGWPATAPRCPSAGPAVAAPRLDDDAGAGRGARARPCGPSSRRRPRSPRRRPAPAPRATHGADRLLLVEAGDDDGYDAHDRSALCRWTSPSAHRLQRRPQLAQSGAARPTAAPRGRPGRRGPFQISRKRLLRGVAERVVLVAVLRERRDAAGQRPAVGGEVHDGSTDAGTATRGSSRPCAPGFRRARVAPEALKLMPSAAACASAAARCCDSSRVQPLEQRLIGPRHADGASSKNTSRCR